MPTMTTLERDREIERLLKPRLSHRRRPHPLWSARAHRKRMERLEQGIRLGTLSPQEIVDEMPMLAGGASTYNVIVDTAGPGGAALALNGNATTTNNRVITARLTTTDTPVTGYQIAIWGDVDTGVNTSIQTAQPPAGNGTPSGGQSAWISPTWQGTSYADQAVTLSTGDGLKTINARIRDDVWNETATLTKTITVDTTAPTVNWTVGPDATKISTVAGKRVVNATFTVGSEAIVAWEVAVVSTTGAVRGSGTVIPTTNGSTGVTGGALAANATQAVAIDARDLIAASAGDGTKIIKVFVQDAAGNWSVV